MVSKEERLNNLSKELNHKLDNYLTDPNLFVDFFKFKQQFHNYSINNTALIQQQYQGAYQVASYKKWQDKGYQVQKGQKAIYILAPNTTKAIVDKNKELVSFWNKATTEQKNKVGSKEYEVANLLVGYNPVPVFDITQTDCPPRDYPELISQFYAMGEVENFDKLDHALHVYRENKGVAFIDNKVFDTLNIGTAKGFFAPNENTIYIKPNLEEKQYLKTYIHELAHSQLHNPLQIADKQAVEKAEGVDLTSNPIMEYQAEMTACLVTEYFGLDTMEVSTNYIHNHIQDMEIKDKSAIVKEVIELADNMIESIEHTLEKEYNMKRAIYSRDQDNDGVIDVHDIDIDNSDVDSVGELHERETYYDEIER